jgi:hypothetical protein
LKQLPGGEILVLNAASLYLSQTKIFPNNTRAMIIPYNSVCAVQVQGPPLFPKAPFPHLQELAVIEQRRSQNLRGARNILVGFA